MSLDQRAVRHLSVSSMIHWASSRETFTGWEQKALQILRHQMYSKLENMTNNSSKDNLGRGCSAKADFRYTQKPSRSIGFYFTVQTSTKVKVVLIGGQ